MGQELLKFLQFPFPSKWNYMDEKYWTDEEFFRFIYRTVYCRRRESTSPKMMKTTMKGIWKFTCFKFGPYMISWKEIIFFYSCAIYFHVTSYLPKSWEQTTPVMIVLSHEIDIILFLRNYNANQIPWMVSMHWADRLGSATRNSHWRERRRLKKVAQRVLVVVHSAGQRHIN